MSVYYEDDWVTLYHGDCRDVLPSLELESIDLVLTDPPYGVDKAEWDSDVFPLLERSAELISPLLKQDGVVFWFGATRLLPETLKATSAIPYRWQFIWYAPNNMIHGDLGFAKYTSALVLAHGKCWREMQDLRVLPLSIEKAEHPTPKPLPLMRYIVTEASKLGASVLDPFAGSGTSLRAAKDCGRRAIGIEIEERYCDLIARRCAQEVLEVAV